MFFRIPVAMYTFFSSPLLCSVSFQFVIWMRQLLLFTVSVLPELAELSADSASIVDLMTRVHAVLALGILGGAWASHLWVSPYHYAFQASLTQASHKPDTTPCSHMPRPNFSMYHRIHLEKAKFSLVSSFVRSFSLCPPLCRICRTPFFPTRPLSFQNDLESWLFFAAILMILLGTFETFVYTGNPIVEAATFVVLVGSLLASLLGLVW